MHSDIATMIWRIIKRYLPNQPNPHQAVFRLTNDHRLPDGDLVYSLSSALGCQTVVFVMVEMSIPHSSVAFRLIRGWFDGLLRKRVGWHDDFFVNDF